MGTASSLYVKDAALFLIDSTTGNAVPTPDIAKYGIMNVSAVTQKVILDKITDKRATLSGAKFELLAYDRSVVATDLTSGTNGKGGAFFIGRLPQGTYYVHETTVPGRDNVTFWWTLTVKKTGAVTLTGPAEDEPG